MVDILNIWPDNSTYLQIYFVLNGDRSFKPITKTHDYLGFFHKRLLHLKMLKADRPDVYRALHNYHNSRLFHPSDDSAGDRSYNDEDEELLTAIKNGQTNVQFDENGDIIMNDDQSLTSPCTRKRVSHVRPRTGSRKPKTDSDAEFDEDHDAVAYHSNKSDVGFDLNGKQYYDPEGNFDHSDHESDINFGGSGSRPSVPNTPIHSQHPSSPQSMYWGREPGAAGQEAPGRHTRSGWFNQDHYVFSTPIPVYSHSAHLLSDATPLLNTAVGAWTPSPSYHPTLGYPALRLDDLPPGSSAQSVRSERHFNLSSFGTLSYKVHSDLNYQPPTNTEIAYHRRLDDEEAHGRPGSGLCSPGSNDSYHGSDRRSGAALPPSSPHETPAANDSNGVRANPSGSADVFGNQKSHPNYKFLFSFLDGQARTSGLDLNRSRSKESKDSDSELTSLPSSSVDSPSHTIQIVKTLAMTEKKSKRAAPRPKQKTTGTVTMGGGKATQTRHRHVNAQTLPAVPAATPIPNTTGLRRSNRLRNAASLR